MILCDSCIKQLSTELLQEDMYVLFSLEGKLNMKDALDRDEIVTLVGKMNYYSVSKVLQKLETLGLICGGRNGKKYLYYLTNSGISILKILLPEDS